jgi:hypothetical protein
MTPEEQLQQIQHASQRQTDVLNNLRARVMRGVAIPAEHLQYLQAAERLLVDATNEINGSLDARGLDRGGPGRSNKTEIKIEYVEALQEHILPLVQPQNRGSEKDLGVWTADPPCSIGGGRLFIYTKCIGGPFVDHGPSRRDTGEYLGWSLTVEGEHATSEVSGPLLFHYQHTPHPAFSNPNLDQEPEPIPDIWINAGLVRVEYQPPPPFRTRSAESPIPLPAPFALFARRTESDKVEMDWSVFESFRASGQFEKLNWTAHEILHRSFPQVPGPSKMTRDEARESLLNAALALAAVGKKARYKTLADQLFIDQNTVWERLDRAEWKIRNVAEHPEVLAALANYRVISGFS